MGERQAPGKLTALERGREEPFEHQVGRTVGKWTSPGCTAHVEGVGPRSCMLCGDGTVGCARCENGRCVAGFYVCGGGGTFCGNGYLEPGEECDGTNLNGATCDSVSTGALPYGRLFCSASCTRVLAGCSTTSIVSVLVGRWWRVGIAGELGRRGRVRMSRRVPRAS